MTDDNTNLVLEHLRGIRERLDGIEAEMRRMTEKIDDNTQATNGLSMIVTMLAGHVHHIDERLEAVENKLGPAA